MRLIVLLMFASVAAFGQAVGSSYYHWSDDGTNIYGSTTVEASMYIINPPPNVTHIYTAAFTLKGPKGATVNAVPVQISEGIYGTEWPVANAEISMANSGFYYLDTSDTAYCSYIEEDFFADNGTDWPIIPPPYIIPGGVADNYTDTNSFAVDSTGTMSIYGESFLCETTCNQADIQVYEHDDPNVTIEAITYALDGQINVGYSIGSSATVGNHCLYVETPYGPSNCGSYMIGDFSPTISSISSTSFVAGTSTPNVQISGQNFGTNCPKFAITPALAGSSFTPTNCTDTLVTGTMNIDPNAAAGEDTVSLTAEGFNGQGFLPAQQGESQQATGTFSVSRISLSIQQGPIAISTGDTSDKIGVSVNPSTFQFSPTLTGALSSNPSSSCTSTLGFPTPPTGTGTVYAPVTASGGASYCSGIFNVLAAVSGSTSPATQVVVPPQVLIQMLYAEAHGQSAPGDASQPMLLATMKNRFGQTVWPGGGTGTWQAVVIPGQVSINTSITTGSQPELSNSASVFTGATPSSIVQDAQAFWSPTTTQWTSIQSYLSAGTPSNAVSDTTWKSTLGAPQAWAGQYKQALVSRSVANNTQGGKYAGAPAFVFLQLAPSGTAPAVISIP